jgi:hypothetical protein
MNRRSKDSCQLLRKNSWIEINKFHSDMNQRRNFLKRAGLATAALGLGMPQMAHPMKKQDLLFKISLAEWSVNRLIFSGQLDHLDFPLVTKQHGIDAVEYVNQFSWTRPQIKIT